MRITITQLLLAILFVFNSYGRGARAQEALNAKISLTVSNLEVKVALHRIQQLADVKFVYSSRMIDLTRKVSFSASDQRLGELLDEILTPLQLRYKVLKDNIVLYPAAADTVSPTQVQVSVAVQVGVGAQSREITGTVTNQKGEPLGGVSVVLEGSDRGTTTNATGKFRLSVPDTGSSTLVVSFVGYETQQVSFRGHSEVTVVLSERAEGLADIVVVGYGTQQKKDLTGSVSQIKDRDVTGLPVGNVAQIMQGKAAGVAITQVTGAPGDGVSVIIRGQASFASSAPLYVIDGIPTDDGINEISPDDIESISILKDASSASIYGARAANGVVVVTTKKGHVGKPRLSVSAYTGVQAPYHLIKMANTAQYVNAYNTAAANDYVAGGSSNRAALPLAMLDTLPDVNWQKAVLKSAPMNNVQMAISGGNESTKYILSADYLSQKGMIMNSSYDRFNVRTSITSTLNKIFEVGTNMNLGYSKTRQVGSSGDGYTASGGTNAGASVVRYALFRTPATPVTYPDGPYKGQYVDLPETVNGANVFGDGLNPVALAANTDRNYSNYTILGDGYLQVTPIPHLKLKSDLGTNLIITDYQQFFPTWGIQRLQNSPNSLAQSNTNNFNYNWTNTGTYDLVARKNTLNILVGSEIIYNNTKVINAGNTGYPIPTPPSVQYISNGTGTTPNEGGTASAWALSSIFARLNYAYDDKYLLSFNFRRDGSSKLDPATQWGNFFSGSAGWRIDREAFMQHVKSISLLKLRVDVGQLGDQSALSPYGYSSLINSNGYYPFGTTSAITSTIVATGNPNLKWQTTTMSDAGLDLGLFHNALTVTADYYYRVTTNLLQNPQNPPSAGTVDAPAYENNGKIVNNGFELEVSHHHRINKDWSYDVTVNLSTLHNEVKSLLYNQPIPAGRVNTNTDATSTAVGHPVGAFYMIEQEGIFQNALDVFTHANQGPGVRPGDVKYKDVNGDGVIDQNDRVYAGSPIPTFTYGLTGHVAYKQFDLGFFFQGVNGDKIYNQVAMDIDGFYRPFNITEATATQSWHGEGTSNTRPLLSWNDATNNTQMSTRFLENGAYLKLKNLQVGYNLSNNALSRLKIESMRFYVSVQNVFVITKYTGQDPEMTTSADAQTSGDGPKALNIDWGTYPAARTFTFGTNINF